ncbi:MAG: methyltransferase domain-containing protein, partial [Planctomycetia bacterium]|nr:methyltransferase domain-containing protein [Planctomycetia bacterium]
MTQNTSASHSVPLLEPLRDFNNLVTSLHDVTGQEELLIRDRLKIEFSHCPSAVPEGFSAENGTPYIYDKKTEKFYEETDSFLYEVIVWNASSEKCKMRAWILACLRRLGLTHGKILLCGDGIGVDSLYFAQLGYQVSSFEVSRYGTAFARNMFRKYHAKVRIYNSLEEIRNKSGNGIKEEIGINEENVVRNDTDAENGNFDVILCLDVLEHLPNPLKAVSEVVKFLRPGGFFIHSSPFYLVAPPWPTHLEKNRKYSGKIRLFEKAGKMRCIDGRFLQNPIVFQKIDETEKGQELQ